MAGGSGSGSGFHPAGCPCGGRWCLDFENVFAHFWVFSAGTDPFRGQIRNPHEKLHILDPKSLKSELSGPMSWPLFGSGPAWVFPYSPRFSGNSMFRLQRHRAAGAHGDCRGPCAVDKGPCRTQALEDAQAANHECRGEGGCTELALSAAQDALKGSGAGQ